MESTVFENGKLVYRVIEDAEDGIIVYLDFYNKNGRHISREFMVEDRNDLKYTIEVKNHKLTQIKVRYPNVLGETVSDTIEIENIKEIQK